MDIRDEVHEWLEEQPRWQQDLARRLARTPSLAEDYQEALDVVLAAHDVTSDSDVGGPDTTTQVPAAITRDDLPLSQNDVGAPRILRFGNLTGVGAVVEGEMLEFLSEGLTVVYGANGSGKTTYVRAMKRLVRTVDMDEQLRPNVFATPSDNGEEITQTALVEFSIHDERQPPEEVELQEIDEPIFDAISVFDARSAELYLTNQNAIAYVPSELKLLTRLASTQNRMRATVATRIEQLEESSPEFEGFEQTSRVQTFLDGLSADTDLADARELAALDDDDRERLEELRAALAATDAEQVRSDARAARNEAESARMLARRLTELATQLEDAPVRELRQAASSHAEAQEAVEVAASEFADLPVPYIGSSPWRKLWEAAREFVAESEADFPPEAEAPCPLCLQEISQDAAARLAHLEEHVTNRVQRNADTARRRFEEVRFSFDPERLDEARTPFLESLSDRQVAMHAELESLIEAIDSQFRALHDDPEADVEAVDSASIHRFGLERG